MSVCIMSVCEHIHFTCACVCVDTQQSFLTINNTKLQALVYNILPPTTTITGYATVSENCQFFTGTQMGIRLLQTTQIISGISIITAHAAYSSTNKTKTVWTEMEPICLPGTDVPPIQAHALTLCRFQSYSYPNLSEGTDGVGDWTDVHRQGTPLQ